MPICSLVKSAEADFDSARLPRSAIRLPVPDTANNRLQALALWREITISFAGSVATRALLGLVIETLAASVFFRRHRAFLCHGVHVS